jgi:hypothetical protein
MSCTFNILNLDVTDYLLERERERERERDAQAYTFNLKSAPSRAYNNKNHLITQERLSFFLLFEFLFYVIFPIIPFGKRVLCPFSKEFLK